MALLKGMDGKGKIMKGTDGDKPSKTNASPTTRELRRKEQRRLNKLRKYGQVEPSGSLPGTDEPQRSGE